MRIFHLCKKALLNFRTKGLRYIISQIFFINRTIVVVEKEIVKISDLSPPGILFVIINNTNWAEYLKKYRIGNIIQHCKEGAQCLVAVDGNNLMGYICWTQSLGFSDVKKLSLKIKPGEAYVFDFFIYPDYRKQNIPKILTFEALKRLWAMGIRKMYGFYFSDNKEALWWHRATLKCKETGKIRMHKFMFLEYVNGRYFLNI